MTRPRGEVLSGRGCSLLDFLIIFFAQATYVSITTVRWIILVRGGRLLAATISFFEIILYVYALGLVVTQLSNPWKVVTYAAGYAVGSLVGSKIEEKLAIGYTLYQVITTRLGQVAPLLREHGLGVTNWRAEGRMGEREVLFVVSRRKLAHKVLSLIEQADPQAFVVRLEPSAYKGGFLQKYLR
ncbi:MAG: DUF2179 domain-containing protein [Bacillota bacterium]